MIDSMDRAYSRSRLTPAHAMRCFERSLRRGYYYYGFSGEQNMLAASLATELETDRSLAAITATRRSRVRIETLRHTYLAWAMALTVASVDLETDGDGYEIPARVDRVPMTTSAFLGSMPDTYDELVAVMTPLAAIGHRSRGPYARYLGSGSYLGSDLTKAWDLARGGGLDARFYEQVLVPHRDALMKRFGCR